RPEPVVLPHRAHHLGLGHGVPCDCHRVHDRAPRPTAPDRDPIGARRGRPGHRGAVPKRHHDYQKSTLVVWVVMGRDRGWIDEIDLVRVVALLAVVAIHVGAWVVWSTTPPSADPTAALVGVARFSVPTFVVLSGLVLYRGHGGRRRLPLSFIRRRLSRVVVPWLCWAPVFIVAALAEGKLDADVGAVLRNLVLGPGHLYFLVLIAQLYVVMLVAPRP